jgi:ubiquinone/menaquinone biosynthesis C-methylase UbiE
MLAMLTRLLPQVRAVVGTAEHLPFQEASFDVVTVAQAWHWLDQDAAAAECARVLRPGGLLAIAWHRRSPAAGSWVDELEELTGDPEYRNRDAIVRRSNLQLPPPFEQMQRATFDYQQELTPRSLAGVASTWSYVATRDDRDQVLATVEQLGHRVADNTGKLVFPHVTQCYRAQR